MKKPKHYEYKPEPDKFVSEILCETCAYKTKCDPQEDCSNACEAYRALEKLMP